MTSTRFRILVKAFITAIKELETQIITTSPQHFQEAAFLFLLVWLQSKHCAVTVLHSGQMVTSLHQSFLSNKTDEVMPLGIHTFLLFASLTITQPFLPCFMPFSTNSIESRHLSCSRFSNTGRRHSTLFRGQAPVANCPCLNLSHVLYFTWPLFHQCPQP